MPDSVYGQPGTKAIFEIGPEWHWELHRKPPDGRKRPLTSLQWHCWSRFQTLAKSLNVKVTLTGFGDNESIFEIKNKMSKKKNHVPCSVVPVLRSTFTYIVVQFEHIWRTCEEKYYCMSWFYWFKFLLPRTVLNKCYNAFVWFSVLSAGHLGYWCGRSSP